MTSCAHTREKKDPESLSLSLCLSLASCAREPSKKGHTYSMHVQNQHINVCVQCTHGMHGISWYHHHHLRTDFLSIPQYWLTPQSQSDWHSTQKPLKLPGAGSMRTFCFLIHCHTRARTSVQKGECLAGDDGMGWAHEEPTRQGGGARQAITTRGRHAHTREKPQNK